MQCDTMFKIRYLVLILFFVELESKSNHFKSIDDFLPEDANLNFTQLSVKYKHKAEEIEVTTEDGYILRIFHIPGKGRPILVMHGLFDTSDTWIITGNLSLAVALAEKGYDIWFGNSRGNRYSRRHVRLDPDRDREFWDFTFNEMGYYDLPATIDLILKRTGYRNLNAIGHSRGNTIFYVLGSSRPEYNEKINIMTALAPVCLTYDFYPTLKFIANFASPFLYSVLKKLQIDELFRAKSLLKFIYKLLCFRPEFEYKICITFLSSPFVGYDLGEIESEVLPSIVGHFPDGSSVNDLYHLAQTSKRKSFSRFDNGRKTNLATYGSVEPPAYDLRKVTMKVVLIAGRNDGAATLPDVARLKTALPNVVGDFIVSRPTYIHLDFVWAKDNKDLLYPFIFKFLQ